MTEPDGRTRVVGRPAPEYGEYAPEGWVSPVAPTPSEPSAEFAGSAEKAGFEDPAARAVTPASFPPDPAARLDAPPPAAGARVPGAPPVPRRRSSFNRFATLLLAVYGAVEVGRSAFDAKQFPSMYVSEFTRLGYITGTFQSLPALEAVALVSAVVSVPIFLLALVWAIRRLRAGRTSWLILLIAGIGVNLITGLIVVGIVMADPSFSGM